MTTLFNDPVIKQLSGSPVFSEFLQYNSHSVQQVLRNTIMNMFEEYTAAAVGGDSAEPETAAEPAADYRVDTPAARTILQKHRLALHSLPPADLEQYAGKAVVLAAASRGPVFDKCEKLLNRADIQVIPLEMGTGDPDSSRDMVAGRTETSETDIRGCIYIASGNYESLQHVNSEAVYRGRILQMKHLLGCAQALQPAMARSGGPVPFFGVVTFNGLSEGPNDPFMAALHSQLNVLPLEYRKRAVVKGVDFYSEEWADPKQLMAELTVQDGYWSVRYDEERRSVYEWVYEGNSNQKTEPSWDITADSVILAVGGGTGITSECIMETAAHSPCTFVLAGRTETDIEPVFSGLVDRDISGTALKEEIINTAEKAGRTVSPARCSDISGRIVRIRDIRRTVADIGKTGSRAVYVSCDITCPESVETLFEMIAFRYGRLDAIVYGAGIDRSKSLLNKDMESFEQVVKPKMLGIMNVMEHIGMFPEMKKIVLFSSFYAWQGMQGSMDYTAGNRFLGEYAGRKAAGMNDLSITAVYWGPWKSGGMAGSEYLEQYFDSYGLDMIDTEQGRAIFMRALMSGITEIAAVARSHNYNDAEWKGVMLNSAVLEANRYLEQHRNQYPFIDRIIDYVPGTSVKAVKRVSLDNDLYMHDHVFDGIPIVPGVIGTEIMAEACKCIVPDKYIIEGDNVRFDKPFQIIDNHYLYIQVEAERLEQTSGETAHFHTELSEITTSEEGKIISEERGKFAADMTFASGEKLENPIIERSIPDVSGLHVFMPIEQVHDICEFVDYHLDRIMVGEVKGIAADNMHCYSENTHNEYPLRHIRGSLEYVINPFLMDICMQNPIRCFFWGYMFRVLPISASLRWTRKAVGLKEFSVKTQVVSIDPNRKRAQLEGIVYDSEHNGVIFMRVETFIRDYVQENPLLFNGMTSDKGYGSLDVFLDGAELALFAAEESVLDKLELYGIHTDTREYDNLPDTGARLDWAASRFALQEVISRIADKKGIKTEEINAVKDENGRMILKHGSEIMDDIQVSLSHSSGWGFVGVSSSCNERIGVDIESMEERDSSFTERTFSESERAVIGDYCERVPISAEDASTVVYSCREALFKALHREDISLNDIILQHIDISGTAEFKLFSRPEDRYTAYFYLFDKKVISAATAT